MDLHSITISGYRRFSRRTTLTTNGKLVAIVGPNESGKSSILDALQLLGSREPVPKDDLTRGQTSDAFSLEGRFFLSDEDLALTRLEGSHWLILNKSVGGARSWTIIPRPPSRVRLHRDQLVSALQAISLDEELFPSLDEETYSSQNADIQKCIKALEGNQEDISDEWINYIEAIVTNISASEDLADTPTSVDLLKHLTVFLDEERNPSPNKIANDAVRQLIPSIVKFDEEARSLKGEYPISQLSSDVPPAFDNLADAADLDLKKVVELYGAGDRYALHTLEDQANETLKIRFREYWRQSGVRASLRFNDDTIAVVVINERREFTPLAERSDGLRQFVALLAFASGKWGANTILLVDEADQRLHYDAQADLVQMFAKQQLAKKVIYTTHSAGCLPEDLGNGVRLAVPVADDPTISFIENKFWSSAVPGFAPLLFGMGAGTLAFFPTRNAVVVEGPSDMLLLPTMMRSALEATTLGFQVVPSLSNSTQIKATAEANAARAIYLVDSDTGGRRLRRKIVKLGVDEKKIISLVSGDGRAVETEDFLHPEILLQAINNIISKHYVECDLLVPDQLMLPERMKSAEAAFKLSTNRDLEKISVAYEVLDLLEQDPQRPALDPVYQADFRDIAVRIVGTLALAPPPTELAL